MLLVKIFVIFLAQLLLVATSDGGGCAKAATYGNGTSQTSSEEEEDREFGEGAKLALVGGAGLLLGLLLAGTIWTWRRVRTKPNSIVTQLDQ